MVEGLRVVLPLDSPKEQVEFEELRGSEEELEFAEQLEGFEEEVESAGERRL